MLNYIPGQTYKQKLTKLKLLPLSLYEEMHDLLTLSSIINNKFDINWHEYIGFSQYTGTRRASSPRMTTRQSNNKNCRQNFWYRTVKTVNFIDPKFIDFFDSDGLKTKLTSLFWAYFTQLYDENNPCTWRLNCDCTNCSAHGSSVQALIL